MNASSSRDTATAKLLVLDASADLDAAETQQLALDTVESGGVVMLPKSGFELTARERELISDTRRMLVRQPTKRNGRPTLIFDPARGRLQKHFAFVDGKIDFIRLRADARPEIEAMLSRFAAWADATVARLFPSYWPVLGRDRVTYRPNARDNTQSLHVDSSYGFPTQGRAMFRVFCNVDPTQRPRVWQVGEPFESFAARYVPRVQPRKPGWRAALLSAAGIVGPKTPYDQLMADLRLMGKRDKAYQRDAPRRIVEFPSGACWFALTDLVIHGAVSGQHSIDQTYFLPASGMRDPARAPLRILERLVNRPLGSSAA